MTGIGIRCALNDSASDYPPTQPNSPDTAAAGAPNLAIDLERAIAELPDGYRVVLVLHDIEGFTHQEIAEIARGRARHLEEPVVPCAPRAASPAAAGDSEGVRT